VTIDYARIGGLLARLPAEIQPSGALQIMDLAAPFEPNPTIPTLIVGLNGAATGRDGETGRLASPVVRRALGDEQAVWLVRADGPAELSTLQDASPSGAEAIFLPAVEPESAERSFAGLRHIVHRLRAPGGCPWDREQTARSLTRYVIEEAYEVVDAIEHHGPAEVSEELGDLLLQVFLQSEIAEEAGDFGLNDVVERISAKLIHRHPHVFADVTVSGAADVEVNWEALKKAEKGERRSVLDGVPKSLPALAMAAEIQKRMRKTGFTWPDRAGAEAKLAEELAELRDAATPEEAAAELGDVLFVLAELATWHGAVAEDALRHTNAKVEARFRYVEDRVRERGVAISDLPLDELVRLWREAKSFDSQPT
jgi:tetrapyrrole methylase family protein/MazG family protein